jgi:hypothetical protein
VTATKFVADLSGDHLDLPAEVTPDYIVQVHRIEDGAMVDFQRLDKGPAVLRWYHWVQDPHGYPGAQDPREPPCGHWAPYDLPADTYRAVVIW